MAEIGYFGMSGFLEVVLNIKEKFFLIEQNIDDPVKRRLAIARGKELCEELDAALTKLVEE